jgi:hypothetical protein
MDRDRTIPNKDPIMQSHRIVFPLVINMGIVTKYGTSKTPIKNSEEQKRIEETRLLAPECAVILPKSLSGLSHNEKPGEVGLSAVPPA